MYHKLHVPGKCAIEIMKGIIQDSFYLVFISEPHEKLRTNKGEFKGTEHSTWGSEFLLYQSSILWLENILWLLRHCFVILCDKPLL